MPDYRRARVPGGTFFFTLVTHERRAFLTDSPARHCLRTAWNQVAGRVPFATVAVCLLPDHLHTIWTLPADDGDFSGRWRAIKGLFSRMYRDLEGSTESRSASRRRKREAGVWQRRFWEHWIRDEDDLRRHIDYIHYNPVRHGYVHRVADWPWSSFHRHVREGWYDPAWGTTEPAGLPDGADLGEVP